MDAGSKMTENTNLSNILTTSDDLPSFTESLVYPELMSLSVTQIEMEDLKHPVSLKISHRTTSIKTTFPMTSVLKFPLSYHALMFDFLKIDLYETRPIVGSVKIGKCRIRLAKLPWATTGHFKQAFPISAKDAPSSPSLVPPASLGTVNVEFAFVSVPAHSYSSADEDGPNVTSPVTAEMGQLTMEPLKMDNHDTDSEWEFLSLANAIYDAPISPDSLYPIPITANVSISSSAVTRKSSSTAASISSGSSLKRSLRPGKLLSERTKLGIKEFSSFASSYFGSGWNLPKFELIRSFMFIQKYFSKYYTPPLTGEGIQDTQLLKDALYWLDFCIASYGSFIIKWCGYNGAQVKDKLKSKGNENAAIRLVNIPKEDMLVWEFGHEEMYKPHFFICRDRRMDAIVVCIRGTWSIQEIMTDMVAEMIPFMGGFAHKGMVRTAMWIEENYLDQIVKYVHEYNAKGLYIVGHSLGAAVACLLTMICVPLLHRFKKNPTDLFKLQCFAYACPPITSACLSEKYNDHINVFVNENDVVPRIGVTAMTELRDMVSHANAIAKTKAPESDKMKAIDLIREKYAKESEYPKFSFPGKTYWMYKKSRMLKNGEPRYVVERCDRHAFGVVAIRTNMIFDHFPDRYQKGLRKVFDLYFDC